MVLSDSAIHEQGYTQVQQHDIPLCAFNDCNYLLEEAVAVHVPILHNSLPTISHVLHIIKQAEPVENTVIYPAGYHLWSQAWRQRPLLRYDPFFFSPIHIPKSAISQY